MSKRVTITIEGYGTVTVKKPRKLTPATFANGIGQAVAETMTLLDPRTPAQTYFHPVYGMVEHERK